MVDPRSVPQKAFEAMVVDALDTLPESVLPVVDELAVLVEEEPAPGATPVDGQLLGLFRGVPRTRRGERVPGTLPDTITLFRLPILRVCPSPEAVPGRVRLVLQHEVGHALGMTEERLRSLGCH